MSATATDLGALPLVTITEAATLLGVKSSWAVYRMAEAGTFGRVYRDGARLLVERGRVSVPVVAEDARWPL